MQFQAWLAPHFFTFQNVHILQPLDNRVLNEFSISFNVFDVKSGFVFACHAVDWSLEISQIVIDIDVHYYGIELNKYITSYYIILLKYKTLISTVFYFPKFQNLVTRKLS